VRPQTVVLMPVDRDTLLTVPFPCVLLKNFDAQQMLHDFGDSSIVIALNPHHFNAALWVAQLANVADEFPVLRSEPREVEVLKNVAEENQALELGMFQEMQKIGCQRDCGAEVNVANDERFCVHDPLLIVS
jgi:hypothetical protein